MVNLLFLISIFIFIYERNKINCVSKYPKSKNQQDKNGKDYISILRKYCYDIITLL